MNYTCKRRWIIGVSIFLLVLLYFIQNFSWIIRVGGFLLGLIIFYLIDHLFVIYFKPKHYILMGLILSSGILLAPLYFLHPAYDKVLHFISPILASILIFYIVDEKKLSIQWKLWITFLFVTSFLMFHEVGEYLIDKLFDMKLQGVYIREGISGIEKLNLVQSRIDDTMIDLIFGSFGALTFSIGKIVGLFFEKRRFK